jgi:hypothetical protein
MRIPGIWPFDNKLRYRHLVQPAAALIPAASNLMPACSSPDWRQVSIALITNMLSLLAPPLSFRIRFDIRSHDHDEAGLDEFDDKCRDS